jgi:hypothetical protein
MEGSRQLVNRRLTLTFLLLCLDAGDEMMN